MPSSGNKLKLIIPLAALAFMVFLDAGVHGSGDRPTRQQIEASDPDVPGAQSVPINISNSGAPSDNPLIGVDADGKAYVVWQEHEGYRHLHFTTNRGGTFLKPQRAATIYRHSEDAGFPAFITAPNGTCHLTFQDVPSEAYEILHYEYGTQWSGPVNVSRGPHDGSAYSTISINPADGFLHAVWMDCRYVEWDFMTSFRDPNSKAWSSVSIIPVSYGYKYLPDLVIDAKGVAHLVYITRPWGISLVWYTMNATPKNPNTWTTPFLVKDETGVNWAWPKVACDDAGNVFVTWTGARGSVWDIYSRSKINNQWGAEANISKSSGLSEMPNIAVERKSGQACIVWQEHNAGDWDVFGAYYRPGAGWSSPSNLTGSPGSQIHPDVAVDDLAKLHLVFADNSKGPFNIMYYSTGSAIAQIYPPINIVLESTYNPASNRKQNLIKWQRNPNNDNDKITEYRIYRKEAEKGNETYVKAASVSAAYLSYTDTNLNINQIYTYVLTSVAQGGLESGTSNAVSDVKVWPPAHPPVKSAVETLLGSSSSDKTNILTWQHNPKNDGIIPVKNYRIYRRDRHQGNFSAIANVSPQTFRYEDRQLPLGSKFVYALTTFPDWDIESGFSESAFEDMVFAPNVITLETVRIQFLYFQEKINNLRWNENPLNTPVSIKSYQIFRKEADRPDSEFRLIHVADAGVSDFVERNVPQNKKFTYVIITVGQEGHQSRASPPVTEK